MKKVYYIWILPLLLTSCSFFTTIPQSVIDGQRSLYQALIQAEDNTKEIIENYIRHTKASIVYHHTFICEIRVNEVTSCDTMSDSYKTYEIKQLEHKRDKDIQDDLAKIDKVALKMAKNSMKNLAVAKKLSESLYNYMSTEPLVVDNMYYWINELDKVK